MIGQLRRGRSKHNEMNTLSMFRWTVSARRVPLGPTRGGKPGISAVKRGVNEARYLYKFDTVDDDGGCGRYCTTECDTRRLKDDNGVSTALQNEVQRVRTCLGKSDFSCTVHTAFISKYSYCMYEISRVHVGTGDINGS